MRSEAKILVDIANATRLILEFTQGLTFEQFKQDIKTQSATLHQMIVLGEATKQLSDGWRDRHPAIRWTEIARMRDHLVHRYFNINLKII